MQGQHDWNGARSERSCHHAQPHSMLVGPNRISAREPRPGDRSSSSDAESEQKPRPVGQITNGRPPWRLAAVRAPPSKLSGPGTAASWLLLFLERKNIGGLVTGGRRQLGDARREIEGDALLADPEDETLRFLIGSDQPTVVFLEGYNFRCS